AIATATLQSSSATTVAAIGFVGAGLITFPESLGIIFGANVGTTITGWLVALIGFKLQLGNLMLAVIFTGVMLRLFGNRRLSNTGMGIAGFALIFIGISTMQQGMGSLQAMVTPDTFPTDTLSGRLILVAIGVLITIITQSSSAGVAAALTAVFTGTINFEQAAALVIGMDVGTTFTALVATIGGSVSSRRTGFSHVAYNIMTAVGALILLTPYTQLWESVAPGALISNAEIALVAFHTTFNILGVILILPFTSVFARFIQRLIPDIADAYTESLDRKLLAEPDLALTATEASIHSELTALLKYVVTMLDKKSVDTKINLTDLQTAIDETQAYIDLIHLEKSNQPGWNTLISIIHSLDHMQRLHERCEEDEDRAIAVRLTPELNDYVNIIITGVKQIIDDIENNNWQEAAERATEFASMMTKEANDIRQQVMSNVAEGKINVPTGTESLEGIRWLRRVSVHVLRIIHYQAKVQQQLLKE
ncbi:MAG: Na/Pi cotransporter family protein, partial [Gammaproteobacteria bacterium]|nr:Na/Pi cotransporter family protein [Gammaproteobacteria bacterium]